MTIVLLMALLAAAPPVSDDDQATIAQATRTADEFAYCAGVWDFFASAEAAGDRPASSEQFRNMANGAQTAALWTHAKAHLASGGKPARYGAWLPLVTPRRVAANLQLHAALEHGDIDRTKREGEACIKLVEAQQKAIDYLRQDQVELEVGPKPE